MGTAVRGALALARKEILYRIRYPATLANLGISPFLIVGPYLMAARMWGAGPEFQLRVAVGLILWYWLSQFFWIVGFGLRDEMWEGVLESLLVVPRPLCPLMLAKFLDSFLVSSYTTATMLVWFLVFGVPVRLLPAQAVVLLCAGLALGALSVLYAGMVLVVKRAGAFGSATQEAIGILSGMTFSVSRLPRPVQVVSALIPLTYAIRAMRAVTITGSLSAARADLAALVGFTVVVAPLGWYVLNAAYARARHQGTLGEF